MLVMGSDIEGSGLMNGFDVRQCIPERADAERAAHFASSHSLLGGAPYEVSSWLT